MHLCSLVTLMLNTIYFCFLFRKRNWKKLLPQREIWKHDGVTCSIWSSSTTRPKGPIINFSRRLILSNGNHSGCRLLGCTTDPTGRDVREISIPLRGLHWHFPGRNKMLHEVCVLLQIWTLSIIFYFVVSRDKKKWENNKRNGKKYLAINSMEIF